MASKDSPTTTQHSLPFGAIRGSDPAPHEERSDRDRADRRRPREGGEREEQRGDRQRRGADSSGEERREPRPGGERDEPRGGQNRPDWRKPENRRGGGKRGGKRRRGKGGRPQDGQAQNAGEGERERVLIPTDYDLRDPVHDLPFEPPRVHPGPREQRQRHRPHQQQQQRRGQPQERRGPQQVERPRAPQTTAEGMFVLEKGGFGVLRQDSAQWLPSKEDVFVPQRLVQQHKLREGSIVEGRATKGQKHKLQLLDVQRVDGRDPGQVKNVPAFKNLTSIDPDFHYAVGDGTGEVSMRIVDLLCPIGRGQRGLIVAPPRSGKTTLMRQFAHGIETIYTDVHLFVLLVDERPEEATEWRRSVQRGKVFVSTADETAKHHIQLAEAVWTRATRLVELGEDVVLLLDSITRLARAYNNQAAGGGRTMSGGLDSRAMERPRKIFGSARNTESAGSLTILGTTLVDTGSRLDQLVFEEFKGTGNMELVLSRRLADRRVFPAIDVERSGTRKEEKLVGMRRLKLIHTLRRVISRMNFAEAMELLITKLDDVEKTDDFLSRFEVDPEA